MHDLRRRFWSKVRRTDSAADCWIWLASRTSDGYGRIRVGNRTLQAHRLAYELERKRPGVGRLVLHSCDNPPCVNPHHLFQGTVQVNVSDKWAKGRGYRPIGEHNGQAKLSAQDVLNMRAQYMRGGVRHQDLSEKYGVNRATISYVLAEKTWKHI